MISRKEAPARLTRGRCSCYLERVRILGAALFVLGAAAAAYSIRAVFHRRRPADVAFAALAPLAVLIALTGLLLVFVPGFFG